MQPGEYTATETINFLSDNFATSEDDTVTVYVERRMTSDAALRSLDRPGSATRPTRSSRPTAAPAPPA